MKRHRTAAAAALVTGTVLTSLVMSAPAHAKQEPVTLVRSVAPATAPAAIGVSDVSLAVEAALVAVRSGFDELEIESAAARSAYRRPPVAVAAATAAYRVLSARYPSAAASLHSEYLAVLGGTSASTLPAR